IARRGTFKEIPALAKKYGCMSPCSFDDAGEEAAKLLNKKIGENIPGAGEFINLASKRKTIPQINKQDYINLFVNSNNPKIKALGESIDWEKSQILIKDIGNNRKEILIELIRKDGTHITDPGMIDSYKRALRIDPDGSLIVEGGNLFINPNIQQQGIGSLIVGAEGQLYNQLGVKAIEIDGVDAGRYVWAHKGIPFKNPEEMGKKFGSWLNSPQGKIWLTTDEGRTWRGTTGFNSLSEMTPARLKTLPSKQYPKAFLMNPNIAIVKYYLPLR
ncbi:MAG: hypothetical protein Q8N88_04460, partial [Nanoarchaeota archaeon]|nr:hypothetical protein [Nanoarchaeota archaeon]